MRAACQLGPARIGSGPTTRVTSRGRRGSCQGRHERISIMNREVESISRFDEQRKQVRGNILLRAKCERYLDKQGG